MTNHPQTPKATHSPAARCSRPVPWRSPRLVAPICWPPVAAARAVAAARVFLGGILVHGATGGSSKDTLDAHSPVQNADISRTFQLYEPLLYWDHDYKVQPAVAESVAPSADAKTWTIKLRKGVTFHNGKDVTPEDVLFTLHRVAGPKPTSGGVALASIIDFNDTKKADASTVVIKLKTPYAVLQYLLAEYTLGVVPTTTTRRTRSAPARSSTSRSHPARTACSPGTTTTGAARPTSTRCTSRTSPTRAPRSTRSRPGRSNDGQPALQPAQDGHGPGWPDRRGRVRRLGAVHDAGRRQAVHRRARPPGVPADRRPPADDRQRAERQGRLGNDLYAPFDPAYAKDLPQREQDIEQAKSLLKQAGQDGIQVELFTGDDIGSVATATASLFAEQAKKAGVDVKVVKKNPFYGDQYPNYPFGQDFWNTRNYLPQAAVGVMKGGTYNETHWDKAPSYPKYAGLVNAAAQEIDETKRNSILQDAQKIEYDEGGYIIWGFRTQVDAVSSKVQGLKPSKFQPLGNYDFKTVSLST